MRLARRKILNAEKGYGVKTIPPYIYKEWFAAGVWRVGVPWPQRPE